MAVGTGTKVRHKKSFGGPHTERQGLDQHFLVGGGGAKKASAKTNKNTGKKLRKTGSKRTKPSKYNKPRGLKTKRS